MKKYVLTTCAVILALLGIAGTRYSVDHYGNVSAINVTNNGIFISTNGFILFGHDGEVTQFTNNAVTYQNGQWLMLVNGQSAEFSEGASIEVNNGSTIQMGRDTGRGVGATSIAFGTNDYLTSVPSGTADNAEHRRYRMVSDITGNSTNFIIRWWEMSNYVAAAGPGGGPVAVAGTNGPFRTSLYIGLATNNPIYMSTNSVFAGDHAGTNVNFVENGVFVGQWTGVDTADSRATNVVVLGTGAKAQANNQFIVGGSTNPIFYGYFGQGYTNRTPTGFEFHATGGLGANDSGGNMVLAAGQGTGLGQGGNITLRVAPPGAGSGSGANSYLDALVLSNITALLHVKSNIVLPSITAGRVVSLDSGNKFAATPMEMAIEFNSVSDGQGLVYNSAMGKWTNGTVGGSGEINTASSLGNGLHLFSDKSGVDLRFNTISNGDNTISIISNNNVFHFRATNITSAQFIAPGNTGNIMYNTNDTIQGDDLFNLVFDSDGNKYMNVGDDGIRVYNTGTTATYIGANSYNVSNSTTPLTFNLDVGTTALNIWDTGTEKILFPSPNVQVDLGTTNFTAGATRMWRQIHGARVFGTNFNVYDSIRYWQTLGAGYNEFTGTNLSSLTSNRWVFSFGSNTLSAAQVWKIHSVASSGGLSTIVITNDTDNAGGGGGVFNVNQFSTTAQATNIKDGVLLTNAVLHGNTLVNTNLGINGAVTNIVLTGAAVGTNVHFDGKLGNYFDFKVRAVTQTNLVFTNLTQGSPMVATVFATNGATRLWINTEEVPASLYVGGKAVTIATNCETIILVYKDSLGSNKVWVTSAEFDIAAAGGLVLHTNFTTGLITVSNSVAGGSNFVVAAAGNFHITNQLLYANEDFNGGTATTNLDFSGSIIKHQTNGVTGNRTLNLTNSAGGRTMVVHLRGDTATAADRTVFFYATNGNTILWRSPTNGTYDFSMHSNQTYTVFFTCLTNGTSTNILAQWNSDSPRPIVGAALAESAGAGTSNAFLPGRVFVSTTSFTNCCATGTTNLTQFTVPGHTLTNSGDSIEMQASGRYSLTGQSKELIIVYGSSNLLSSGSLAVSNGTWTAETTIYRTGNTEQSYKARITWTGQGQTGGATNWSGLITETNGIDTVIKMQTSAGAVASVTNSLFVLDWWPGPR